MAKKAQKPSARLNKINRLRESSIFVELSFSDDGKKLQGLIFRPQNEDAEKIMSDLMDGEIRGLEYCEPQNIKMVGGGQSCYHFAISKPNAD